MRSNKFTPALFCAIIFCFACNNKPTASKFEDVQSSRLLVDEVASNTVGVDDDELSIPDTTALLGAYFTDKLVKKANIKFSIDSIAMTRSRIREIIVKYDGYIEAETEDRNDYSWNLATTVRVPQESFMATVYDLTSLAKTLDYKNISARNVYIDYMVAQMQENAGNPGPEGQRGTNTELAISRQIGAKAQLLRLDDAIKWSTIKLEVYREIPYVPAPQPTFFMELKDALSSGVMILGDFILFFARYLFVLLLAIMVYWVSKLLYRKYKLVKPGK